eukprot:UC1_evm2s691
MQWADYVKFLVIFMALPAQLFLTEYMTPRDADLAGRDLFHGGYGLLGRAMEGFWDTVEWTTTTTTTSSSSTDGQWDDDTNRGATSTSGKATTGSVGSSSTSRLQLFALFRSIWQLANPLQAIGSFWWRPTTSSSSPSSPSSIRQQQQQQQQQQQKSSSSATTNPTTTTTTTVTVRRKGEPELDDRDSFFARGTYRRVNRAGIEFHVGQIVVHRKYGYRGVIVGWDRVGRAPAQWYTQMGVTRENAARPFYSVLADNRDREGAQMTYVQANNLRAATGKAETEPIMHELIDRYLEPYPQSRVDNSGDTTGLGRSYRPKKNLRKQYPLG